jgi:hypothetical protein
MVVGSDKMSFFIKYITQHFQLFGKNVLLSTTIGAATFHLNSIITIIHNGFQIPTQRYLSIIPKIGNIIKCFKNTRVIIVDEMLMMTNNMLCVVEQ